MSTPSSPALSESQQIALATVKKRYVDLDRKMMDCLKLMRGKRPTSGNWWLRNTTWPYTWMGLRLLECVTLTDEITDLIKEAGLELVDLPANTNE